MRTGCGTVIFFIFHFENFLNEKERIMLEIRNLSKTYGTKMAVNNLSFTIEDGDIMGFIGKNGAGKTTTLKSCLGLIKIDKIGRAHV